MTDSHIWDTPPTGPRADEALCALLIDARRLPATGRCHGCGKPVLGERRLCGTCAVRLDERKTPRFRYECERCGRVGTPRRRRDQADKALQEHRESGCQPQPEPDPDALVGRWVTRRGVKVWVVA